MKLQDGPCGWQGPSGASCLQGSKAWQPWAACGGVSSTQAQCQRLAPHAPSAVSVSGKPRRKASAELAGATAGSSTCHHSDLDRTVPEAGSCDTGRRCGTRESACRSVTWPGTGWGVRWGQATCTWLGQLGRPRGPGLLLAVTVPGEPSSQTLSRWKCCCSRPPRPILSVYRSSSREEDPKGHLETITGPFPHAALTPTNCSINGQEGERGGAGGQADTPHETHTTGVGAGC